MMELKKKYNLITAIAMVVGIIVGSGVFFKASGVLSALEGNMILSILAWILGGCVMIVSAYTFSLVAANCKKSAELIDMANETVGRRHAYSLSWYCAVLYYPLLVGVLGWVCSSFTAILFGVDSLTFVVIGSFIYVICICIFNFIAPKIAGHFQVSTTVIKLIPLSIMALFGVFYGLLAKEGMLVENFTNVTLFTGSNGFMGALCGTCFAYEGWIVATTISKELNEPKKNLSKALVIGTLIVLGIYIAYYIGLAGTYANSEFIANGDEQVKLAFSKIFGGVGGTILYIFVVISCVGTLNGLTMGAMRNLKSIADTNNGPKPEMFKTLNKFNVNTPSALIGSVLSIFWLAIWLFVLYKGLYTGAWWAMDISELVIIFVYMAYIPIYISIIRKRDDLNKINRYVMPVLATLAALLMIAAAIISHGIGCLIFLIIASIIIAIGLIFYKEERIDYESTN